jgi:hypothetical protein
LCLVLGDFGVCSVILLCAINRRFLLDFCEFFILKMCDSVADRAWKRSRSVSLYLLMKVLHRMRVVCVCVCVHVYVCIYIYSLKDAALPVGHFKLSVRSKSFRNLHHIVSQDTCSP